MNQVRGNTQIKDNSITPDKIEATNSPVTGKVLGYNSGDFEWVIPSGSGGLTNPVDYIDFNTAYVGTSQEARLKWNTDDGTLDVGMPGGVVNLQLGEENLVRVTNKNGTDLPNGMPVYINGATGNTPTVKIPNITNRYQTFGVVGMATEPIADNHKGYINTFGYTRDVNTISIPEGSDAFLSISGISQYPPAKPNRTVWMGIVTKSHATEGIIWGHPIHLPFIDELSDVVISGAVNNNLLAYNSSNQTWGNTTASGLGLFTGSIAANQVAYSNGTNTLQGSANFTFDGSTITASGLHVNGSFTNYNKLLPDIGAIQTSNIQGYGADYITDKALNACTMGSNGTAANGGFRMTTAGVFQVYANGAWNNVVMNFSFREDPLFGYCLEHAPTGFVNYIEIMTGQTLNNLGLNGLPLTNAYRTSMGSYPIPTIIGGRSIT